MGTGSAAVKRWVMILVGQIEQTPGRFAKLNNSGVVKQDVSNGDDVLAGWEHGKCCAKKEKNKHFRFIPSSKHCCKPLLYTQKI